MFKEAYDERIMDSNMDETRFVIKRSGKQVPYEAIKIKKAIKKANLEEARLDKRLTDSDIEDITNIVTTQLYKKSRALGVEEIQDIIEEEICKRSYSVFILYHDYRNLHQEKRKMTDLDAKIQGIVEVTVNEDGSVSVTNEEVKQENSNKNPTIVSVQRDYMAGEWSRHYTNKYLLPEDIVKAHEEGIIHFHDTDYFSQHIHNCDLINLEDMLQNGTCISGTHIDKPKSFATACTVASQIVAGVASSQYGGQTISLSHLAPFVDVSRQKIRKRLGEELKEIDVRMPEEKFDKLVEKEVMKEIEAGCQTIQYQLITLQSTNGQAPFITVLMYLNEVPEGQTRHDLALCIEIMLKQRILGVKDRSGHYITPAFPKLIYILQEDNIEKDSPYYYLTELSAKCTAKRMVPDYISEKKMKELKGDVYPCMGCVDGHEIVTYNWLGQIYTENFERMWDRMSKHFKIEFQPNHKDFIMRTPDLLIWDQKKGFVANYGIIKNHTSEWLRFTFSNGAVITCTYDHPFETTDGRLVLASNLCSGDLIDVDSDDNETCYPIKIEQLYNESFSYDVTTESEHFTVSGIYSHNCRSFLTPDRFTSAGVGNIANALNYKESEHKYYGRFNQGVVTLNLIDIACSSGKDMDKFWKLMEERLDLCHRALRLKHERLLGTPSDIAPILWQDGALARLEPGETIDRLLFDGYSTISLGYAGLYECVYYMLGVSHTTEEGRKFGLAVMQALNDACSKWKSEENIDYSVYGTPLESTTYKFAKCLQKRFGMIPEVTDRNYITNSYHISVREKVNAFEKLSKEAEFQALSPGGAISYIEVPDMQNNIPAVIAVLKHIYNTILYAELNTKSDYCDICGFDGEIQLEEKHGKLIWKCPCCGNEDQTKMHVARRTCGYIGTQYWNQGRTAEIKDRVLHL